MVYPDLMYDLFVIVGLILLGTGGFIVLYAVWIYLCAKVSRISFKKALKWWED